MMLRELIAPGQEQVAFKEYKRARVPAVHVRVRSLFAAAKHGTEMAAYKGYAAPRGSYDPEYQVFTTERSPAQYPTRLGNMAVGEVIELGMGVTEFALGEMVFRHSPFRQEHVWPTTNLRRLPAGVPWQAAVCLDPAEFAVDAIRVGNVRIGDAVAVFGMGAIGLIALQIAKLAGAYPVIAVDPLPLRRAVALECGADMVLDPAHEDAGLEIKKATHKRGADVCIEYSGHYLGMQAALRGVAYNGVVVAGAWPPVYPAGLDFGAEAHFNRPKIVFARACSEPNPDYPNWDEKRLFEVAWRLLASGAMTTIPIIHPIVKFDDLLEE
ncbi:MAG: zinc-binding alcohol dehydrogenase, partial [Chloroflexota bacterium]|nr:zinc-binding alcohol dehydrogenase [Chloroflexota bacterium]